MSLLLTLAIASAKRPTSGRARDVRVNDVLSFNSQGVLGLFLVDVREDSQVYGLMVSDEDVLVSAHASLDLPYRVVSEEGGLSAFVVLNYEANDTMPRVNLATIAGEQEVLAFAFEHTDNHTLRKGALKLLKDGELKSRAALKHLQATGQMDRDCLAAITDPSVALDAYDWARKNAVHLRANCFEQMLHVATVEDFAHWVEAHPDRETIYQDEAKMLSHYVDLIEVLPKASLWLRCWLVQRIPHEGGHFAAKLDDLVQESGQEIPAFFRWASNMDPQVEHLLPAAKIGLEKLIAGELGEETLWKRLLSCAHEPDGQTAYLKYRGILANYTRMAERG